MLRPSTFNLLCDATCLTNSLPVPKACIGRTIGVLEFQKNGNAHLHVLLGQYIPWKWLSKAWQSIGGGKVVDIRFVDVHRVSAYLSVYLVGDKVKSTLELLPMRARIFTTSRSIVL